MRFGMWAGGVVAYDVVTGRSDKLQATRVRIVKAAK
jgi:hypothetical protein